MNKSKLRSSVALKALICIALVAFQSVCGQPSETELRENVLQGFRGVIHYMEIGDLENTLLKISDILFSMLSQATLDTQDATTVNTLYAMLKQTDRMDGTVNRMFVRHFSADIRWLLQRMHTCLGFLQINYKEDFVLNNVNWYSFRRNPHLEEFWRNTIQQAAEERMDVGFIIDTLAGNKGVCYIFKHPVEEPNLGGIYGTDAAHRLAFLLCNRVEPPMEYMYVQNAINELARVCFALEDDKLNDGEYKALLFSLLQPTDANRPNLRLSHLLNSRYVPDMNDNSICERLERLRQGDNNLHSFTYRFPKQETQGYFFSACMDELELLCGEMLSMNGIYTAFNEITFKLWFQTIGDFVARQSENQPKGCTDFDFLHIVLDPNTHRNFNNLLLALVSRLDAKAAVDAYETGRGLCDIIMSEQGMWVYKHYESISNFELRLDFIADHNLYHSLKKVVYMYITCKNLLKQRRQFQARITI